MGHIATRPTQRKGGANDQRQPKLGEHARRLVSTGDTHTAWHDETNVLYDLLEQLPVLSLFDGLQLRPNELDPVVFEHTGFGQRHRQIERGLTTHRR